jgi:hypothetical protein
VAFAVVLCVQIVFGLECVVLGLLGGCVPLPTQPCRLVMMRGNKSEPAHDANRPLAPLTTTTSSTPPLASPHRLSLPVARHHQHWRYAERFSPWSRHYWAVSVPTTVTLPFLPLHQPASALGSTRLTPGLGGSGPCYGHGLILGRSRLLVRLGRPRPATLACQMPMRTNRTRALRPLAPT